MRASGQLPVSVGAVGGTLAYLLDVALLVAVETYGLYPARVHLPVWDGLRTEVLIYTVLVSYLLVLGGFLVTRSVGVERDGSFRTGGSIVVGGVGGVLAK